MSNARASEMLGAGEEKEEEDLCVLARGVHVPFWLKSPVLPGTPLKKGTMVPELS